MSSGWHGERYAHSLCARGVKVRPDKMKATKKQFLEVGKGKYIDRKENIFALYDKKGVREATMDIQETVDKVVKELWKLKWHKEFDTNGQMPNWPEWMKKFKEY